MTQIDPKNFRNALGKFATGVTIVTTLENENTPVGVTASSFNSVSLEPPLVLWSLAKSAKSLETFSSSGHFAVHILASHQDALSNQFARSGDDKFASMDWNKGKLGSPLLPEYAAQFQCKTKHQYEGGDHIIFVGEVVAFEEHEKSPLVFHGGAYADATPKVTKSTSALNVDIEQGRFTDDFILYLLARAHFQSSYPSRKKRRALGLTETEFWSLSLISMSGQLTIIDLCNRMSHTGFDTDEDTVRGLSSKGLVIYAPHTENPIVTLTEKGLELFLHILADSKATEEQILSEFSDGEIGDLKHLLKRFINITSAEIPGL